MIHIKRIYEAPSKQDGFRILIDRLWPRGIKKEVANIDKWAKNVAPSTALCKWFGHDPAKWKEFKRKYMDELKENDAVADLLKEIKMNKTATLLYATHNEEFNQAVVLRSYLQNLD